MTHLLIRDLPNHQRPREKLIERGSTGLSDAELLAILFRVGVRGKSAIQLAEALLTKFPLSKLLTVSLTELQQLKGLGPAKATQLFAALEIARRAQESPSELPLNKAERIVNLLNPYRHRQKEYFIALYLNARYHLIAQEEISVGHLTASLVHPREVFKPAFQHSAASIILAHNHPSGDPQPSKDDILLTHRLVEAGKLLDIDILDHLIVTTDDWCSLKELGHV